VRWTAQPDTLRRPRTLPFGEQRRSPMAKESSRAPTGAPNKAPSLRRLLCFFWRASRAGLLRRFAPRNDAEALRECALSVFNCQTARVLRSPDGAQRNPGLSPQRIPDCASLHPGYTQTRVITPRSSPARGSPVSSAFLRPRGRAERWAILRARGAVCRNTRPERKQATVAVSRLRSARDGFFGLQLPAARSAAGFD